MTSPSRRLAKGWAGYPWLVILFGAYPVLALAAANVDQIRIVVILRPLLLSVVGASVLWGALILGLRDWRRAAFLSVLLLVLFYSYGHVYHLLREISPQVGRGRYLVPLWGLLAVLSVFIATRPSLPLRSIIPIGNGIAACLTLLAAGQIFWFQRQQARTPDLQTWSNEVNTGTDLAHKPDIYYITLDSYGRSDTLATAYGVDNTDFLQQLTEMGFSVASCSQSNYAQTSLALASTLNLDYLENLGVVRGNPQNDALLIALSRYNRTRRFLEAQGYQVINFASGFVWSEWPDADVYLSPPLHGHLSEFETLLLRSSFGLALLDAGLIHLNREGASSFRARTLYVLDTLPQIAAWDGPKFVFAHLIVPHPPFVFGPNGEVRENGAQTLESQYSLAEYRRGYAEQVAFINQRLIPVLESILTNSPRPVVILLQGDHGPGFSSWADRMKILNAYYLPAASESPYPSISPVNSFRLILNNYFHTTYPLLEDRSFFSSYNSPYDFQEISNDCTPTGARDD